MSLLKINNLTLGYGEKVIFPEINIEEDRGSNGRGKSTLLRTIASLEQIYTGEILFDGKPLKSYNRKQMSELVSFVSPIVERADYLSVEGMLSINAYHRTNWLGTLTPKERDRIMEALRQVGMESFIDRSCNSLSDGEYQRITIAGALVQDSQIILLDEPTAFLDIANRFMVTRLLAKIAHVEKKLLIFSTHDLSLAMEICDKLWVMTPDKLYSDTPKNLIAGASSAGGEGCILEKMFELEGVEFDHTTSSFVLKNYAK